MKYSKFAQRAEAALGAAGARVLLSTEHGQMQAPDWARDWDRILLIDNPGQPQVIALTDGSTVDPSVIRDRIDRLSVGLHGAGLMSGPTLRLISVVAVSPGVLASSAQKDGQRFLGLAPTTYYSGLRPTTWVAELPADSTSTGGRLRAPGKDSEEKSLLRAALSPDENLDLARIAHLQSTHRQRTAAFYELMRGRPPLVTWGLIAANVAVFAGLYINGINSSDQSHVTSLLTDWGALVPQLVQQGQWWRLFSAMFLHASVTHVLVNMASLYFLGVLAERLYGNVRFLAIYLGSGLVASLSSFFYAVLTTSGPRLLEPSVGASGAIFGIAGALLMVRFQSSDVIPRRVRDSVFWSLVPIVALNLLLALFVPYLDNAAHIGGLVGGMLLAFALPVARQATTPAAGLERGDS